MDKWNEAFPGKPMPTDKDSFGDELVKGKWVRVVYITKEGATPFVYDIVDEDGQAIEAHEHAPGSWRTVLLCLCVCFPVRI